MIEIILHMISYVQISSISLFCDSLGLVFFMTIGVLKYLLIYLKEERKREGKREDRERERDLPNVGSFARCPQLSQAEAGRP